LNGARSRWAAVIVAAGRGERFGRPKQLLELAGLPMVGWSIRTFADMPEVAELIVVTESAWLAPMRELYARLAPGRTVRVVEGGATRQESVRNGLHALPHACVEVLIHDGARPLICADDVRAGMDTVREGRAAVLASRVVDTIKRVDPATLRVVETLERTRLWAAQTPQFATIADLRRAHARAQSDGFDATDDTALLERIGVEVTIVEATRENFKVTRPADIARAQAILHERASPAPRA
jgi:2-C-methyl-D-erythritol 4-phosphate cytidylyltransferase